MRFNAAKAITITSVTIPVYQGPGLIDIAVLDNLNNEIGSTGLVNISAGGYNTISLNISLPAGNGYQLVTKQVVGSLFFVTSGTPGFPLASNQGAMTLTGGMNGLNQPNQTYYYFYDIKFTTSCYSSRVPVLAYVKPVVPVTATASSGAVCAGSSVNLQVSSTNDPNYSYFWLPDGLSGANVTVTPAQSTIYTVLATDISGGPSNGCQAIKTVTVSVIPAIPPFTITPGLAPICKLSLIHI